MFPVYDITRRRSPATPHRDSVSRQSLQQSQNPSGNERTERRLSSPLKPHSRRMSTLCRATEAVTQRPTIQSTDLATPRVQTVCRKTFTPEVGKWPKPPITTCMSRRTFAPRETASLTVEMDGNSPRRRPDHEAKTHRKVCAGTVDPQRSRDQRTAATTRGATNARGAEVHLTKHTRQQTTQPIRQQDRQLDRQHSRQHSHQHHRQQSQHSHQHSRQHSRHPIRQPNRQPDNHPDQKQTRTVERLPPRPLERLPLRRVSTCSAAFNRNAGASIVDRRTCRTSEQIKERKRVRLREKETATILIQRCFRWRFRMKESLRRITRLTAAVRTIQRWWRRKRLQWKVVVPAINSHEQLILDLLQVPKRGVTEQLVVPEFEKEPLQLEQSPLLVPRMRLRSVKFEDVPGVEGDLSSRSATEKMYFGACHSERRLQE